MVDKTRAAMARIKGKYPEVKHWQHITGISPAICNTPVAMPSSFYWCSPDGVRLYPKPGAEDKIVLIPYKPPSPELMKILEQAQQLASEACFYGSAFMVTGPDGSKRRVDPAAVRVAIDEWPRGTRPITKADIRDAWERHFKAALTPEIRTKIADYTKAWEDDIMTAGNVDQVGGLKDLLSRTHEADKPGVTAMVGDAGAAQSRARGDKVELVSQTPTSQTIRLTRAEASKPGVTQMALSVMGDGPLKTCPKCQGPFRFLMDETTCWRCSGATTASFPVAEKMARRLCPGTADGIAITSAAHPPGSLLAAELAAEITELRPASDATLGSLHWVEAEVRQATTDSDVPAIRPPPLRAVWQWCGDLWSHDGVRDFPPCAYLAGWRYLGPAEYVAPQPKASWIVPSTAMNLGDRVSGSAATAADPIEPSWRRNLVWHLRNDHPYSRLIQYAADRIEELEIAVAARSDAALHIDTGNTHLARAASFGKTPVTPEMKWAGFQAGLELQPRAPLQGETVEAIYRAMHAAAPVPLVSEAEDQVAWLEAECKRLADGPPTQHPPEFVAKVLMDREGRDDPMVLARLTEVIRCARLDGRKQARDEMAALTKERDEALAMLDGTLKDRSLGSRRDVAAIKAMNDRQGETIAALAAERSGMQEIIDLLSARCQGWADEVTRLRAGMTSAEAAGDHPYHGPTETVPHPDYPRGEGKTIKRAIPDSTHEQFHRSIGDVLAGKIIPAARRQMEEALGRAPKEPTAAPDAILRGNKAPVGIVERQT